jgi:DNA invertase Pin-like site-specific DNA recombinase
MRVAVYARISTRDKGQDYQNQLRDLKAYVSARRKDGWKLVHSYVDQASGKNGERPEFQKLFEDAGRRKFDLLLFWSLDRFSREGVLETLQHLQRLTAAGVDYKSYTEQYLDSLGVFRDAVLSILATIAKQERVRIRERTIAGQERARAQGTRLGRPRLVVDHQGGRLGPRLSGRLITPTLGGSSAPSGSLTRIAESRTGPDARRGGQVRGRRRE